MPENADTELQHNPDPFADFAHVVSHATAKHIGWDAAGNETGYVPFDVLKQHWTPRRISEVLRAIKKEDETTPNIKNIGDHYLRIFSTLVDAGPQAVRYLQCLFISHGLTDAKLPSAEPRPSRNDDHFTRCFRSISDHQWKFFPLDFQAGQLDDLHLDDRRILPITLGDGIYSSPAVEIHPFTIHDGFDRLGPVCLAPTAFAVPTRPTRP